MTDQRVSIVIPAHNEEGVITRLLTAVVADEFDIVVVCNGCTDETAGTVRTGFPSVRVVETSERGKHHALRLGDRHTDVFPRVYLDADVVLRAADVRALTSAIASTAPTAPATPAASAVLAAAPERRLALAGRPWTVRWFYAVWLRLPGTRDALYGRGAIALSEDGWRRVADLPPLMGDDLAIDALFAPQEREIVPAATVVIHPPRTGSDLLNRRVRAVTSTYEFEHSAPGTTAIRSSRTGVSDLVAVVRAEPRMLPQVMFFAALAVVARRKARRAVRSGDFATWLRDDSSRRS